METFSALLAICAGNSPVPGEFPAQRPVTRSFGVFFDPHPNNGWVHNGEAGDLRRYRAHYDVAVMTNPANVRGAVIYINCILPVLWPSDVMWCCTAQSSLVQAVSWHPVDANPTPEITWYDANLLSVGSSRTNFEGYLKENIKHFIRLNAFENVIPSTNRY